MGGKASKKGKKQPPQQQQQQPLEYDLLSKVLIIGDSGVGKTSLLQRLAENTFYENHQTLKLLGRDFVVINTTFAGHQIRLQLWDTQGQERFATVTSSYYRGATIVMVAFDLTNRDSFKNVRLWLGEVDRYGADNTKKLVVGTKADLDSQRLLSPTEIESFTTALSVHYVETSAKTGAGCDQLLEALARTSIQAFIK